MLRRKANEFNRPSYQIIVDNHASKENTTRYAEHGYHTSITEKDGEYTLTLQMTYIATFYSHFGAIAIIKNYVKDNQNAQIIPVARFKQQLRRFV